MNYAGGENLAIRKTLMHARGNPVTGEINKLLALPADTRW